MIFSPINVINFCLLFITTLFILLSSSWLGVWTIIEFNMFRFLPLILVSSLYFEEEGVTKYFVTQIIASIILLWRYILIIIKLDYWHIKYFILLSIMIKIGSFPCYSWYPSVIKAINWFNCIILRTLQKIGPCLLLLIYLDFNILLLISIRLFNVFIGGIFGLFQIDLRSLLAYSSISHIGWILSSYSLIFKVISIIYFLFYLLLSLPIFIILLTRRIYFLPNLVNLSKDIIIIIIRIFIMLLSLRGIPPLTGFFPKLVTLLFISKYSILFRSLLVIFSVFSIYMYIIILFSLLFFYFKQYFLKEILTLKLMISIIYSTLLIPSIVIFYAMILFN